MASHAPTALVHLTSLLSTYLAAARDEEDAAAALHSASARLEREIAAGREKALCSPHEHPLLVEARCRWWRAARQEAHTYRDWADALNRYLRRGPESTVSIQISDGWRYYPAELHNGLWLQLRTFDRPETEFASRKAAVLWLHHQFMEPQPAGMETLLSLWPTADLLPPEYSA